MTNEDAAIGAAAKIEIQWPFCKECRKNLEDLPIEAKFCPKCGHLIEDRPKSWLRSQIIKSYGAAMNGLGIRYEHGRGVQRNEDEAIRCYTRAARFGNDEAIDRLQSQPERRSLPDSSLHSE